LARLCAELGVDRRTVRRWRQWWHEQFVRLAWWKAEKGRFIPPVSEQALPSCASRIFHRPPFPGLTRH
jgi:hypothetical protein